MWILLSHNDIHSNRREKQEHHNDCSDHLDNNLININVRRKVSEPVAKIRDATSKPGTG